MNKGLWTLSWVLMLFGGVALAASMLTNTRHEKRQKYKGKATATVVEIIADEPDKKGKAAGIHDYYYALFAYYAGGRLYKIRYPRGGNPCPFSLNQKIDIQYDLRKPIHFRIKRKSKMESISNMLYYGGILMILTGGVLFVLCALRIA